MPESPQKTRVAHIAKRLGIVRPRDLRRHGIYPDVLAELVREGDLVRIGRGLYSSSDSVGVGEHWGLMEVAKRTPNGVVCLLSALAYHGIGTQMPSEVWLAIGHKANPPVSEYPPLRIVRMLPRLLTTLVESTRIGGVPVSITTPARTVVDCFKFRNKIGVDIAIEALREGWKDRRFSMRELTEAGTLCRMTTVMRPYLEMLE